MSNSKNHPQLSLRLALLFLIVAGIPLLALFYQSSAVAIQVGDAQACWFQSMHTALKEHFFVLWAPEYRLGDPYGPISPDFNTLLLRWTDFPLSPNLLFSLNLLLGGIGMFMLLRGLKLADAACILGGLAYLMSNTVLTLVLPGHVNKVMSCAWLPFSVAAFLAALRDGRLGFYAVSGAFLGLGLLAGEVQVPYYLGLWYTVWLLLSFIRDVRARQGVLPDAVKQGAGFALVAVCSLGIGMSTVMHSLQYFQKNAPIVGATETVQNWHFATQYYFPPEEVLSYLTTVQFFGGPHVYWGRDGAPSPLRLSDDYMGLLPLGFAVLGGIACWRIWQARLFVIMAIGSLLASFGREGGLYWLLYQLPTMKAQRNPHRWSYFVSLAVCVLAAYGVDWMVKRLRQSRFTVHGSRFTEEIPAGGPTDARDRVPPSSSACDAPNWALAQRLLLATVIGGAVLFLVAWFLCREPRFAAGSFYGAAAIASEHGAIFVERTRMLFASLMRTGLFLALSGGAVWWVIAGNLKSLSRNRGDQISNLKFLAPWAAVLLVLILDLGFNAKRYIRFYPWKEVFEKNAVANLLRADHDFFRVKAMGLQHPVLNDLVSNVLPFHRIPVVDPPAVSRMPHDYQKFFDYAQHHFVRTDRYFDFFNVKYILSPQPFSNSYLKLEHIAEQDGIHVYRRDYFMPRAWLAASAKVVTGGDDAVLFATLSAPLDLRETVVLEEIPKAFGVSVVAGAADAKASADRHSMGDISRNDPHRVSDQPSAHPLKRKGNLSPAKPDSNDKSKESQQTIMDHGTSAVARALAPLRVARITHYEDNRFEVETFSEQPAMLVLSEKWDPDWKAWLDNAPVKVFKANFLMRAVETPPGKHTVRMEYRPSSVGFWVSAISVLSFAGFGLGFYMRRRLRQGNGG